MEVESNSNRRRATRITPGHPVFVAIEGAQGPVARGLVSNISEGGVCVTLRGPFQIGDEVILRISFGLQPRPVPATGRVVWALPTDKGTDRFGIEWTNGGPQRDRLGALIRNC